jgi:hypothetical protein
MFTTLLGNIEKPLPLKGFLIGTQSRVEPFLGLPRAGQSTNFHRGLS